MLTRLSLRLRIFLFFSLLVLGSLAITGFAQVVAFGRLDPAEPLSAFVLAGLITGFLVTGLILSVWWLFDENVARAIEALAASLRARAHGGVDGQLDPEIARYLGDLAPAASAVTETLSETKSSVQQAVAQRTALLENQAEKLRTLVGDVPVGLVICGPTHRIVFYNPPARDILAETGRPRLDRSVFDLLREGPIRKTYARLLASGAAEQTAEILLSTTGCAKSLSVHMRLIRDTLGMTREAPGYVLTLRDVTADLAAHRDRERLLTEMLEQLRPPATALKALLDLHREVGDEAGARLGEDILQAADRVTEAVQSIGDAYEDSRHRWWPMQEVRASELIDGIRAHLGEDGPVLEAKPPHLLVTCDGVTLIDLLAALARRVKADGLAEILSLSVTPDGDGAELRLSWTGEPLSIAALEDVLDAPVEAGPDALTGSEVLKHHGTAIWPEWDEAGTTWLTLPLAEARPTPASPAHGAFVPERSAVFDFDLLQHTTHAQIDDTPLRQLTYVVFDTETTGLNPNGGDEIVQIAALRIVNGRKVPGEVIDQLVDPERSIPPGATAVHGVTEAMVRGAPTIREAGPRFHRFCHNAVLVAHNAPFDLAFFHRHGPSFGATFDNPVLDTVLLSAILFGQQEEHTLDALAARFGVVIPEEARHTAYGDTLATAEVFLRMIPMLEAKGLDTFGDVLRAMEANNRLMKEMRARVEA